jgi:hypothetical protein
MIYRYWPDGQYWDGKQILPTTNMRHTYEYEGIGIYVDDWKINPISLLEGHGNRKIVYSAVLKGVVLA